jgi:hypothetical protein
LLLAVVGSGIMAQRLCGGNIGLALLANALATGGALIALILAFGSGLGRAFESRRHARRCVATASRGRWPSRTSSRRC